MFQMALFLFDGAILVGVFGGLTLVFVIANANLRFRIVKLSKEKEKEEPLRS